MLAVAGAEAIAIACLMNLHQERLLAITGGVTNVLLAESGCA